MKREENEKSEEKEAVKCEMVTDEEEEKMINKYKFYSLLY